MNGEDMIRGTEEGDAVEVDVIGGDVIVEGMKGGIDIIW